MNSQTYHSIIYWEKTKQGGAVIFRIFGTSPAVTVPAHIDGYPVTDLADYCFAAESRLPEHYFITEIKKETNTETYKFTSQPSGVNKSSAYSALAELSGNYLNSVQLPDTLTELGSYAFFNCRNLSCIEFGQTLKNIGSDAFMNCRQLHQLYIRCGIREKTGLQKILNQIFWNVEVSFLGNPPDSFQKEAVILFPEYYELYDEIAPAHIFGRTITGEGFRARQSFQEGIIDFHQYDKIFKKACAEESVSTVCLLAFYRLYYPKDLSLENQTLYEAFILANGEILCRYFVQSKNLDALFFLFHKKLLSIQTAQYAAALSAQTGWAEGSASILRWKQQFYHKEKRSRYEFKNF